MSNKRIRATQEENRFEVAQKRSVGQEIKNLNLKIETSKSHNVKYK